MAMKSTLDAVRAICATDPTINATQAKAALAELSGEGVREMRGEPPPRAYSAAQVAALTGKSRRTISLYARRGLLVPIYSGATGSERRATRAKVSPRCFWAKRLRGRGRRHEQRTTHNARFVVRVAVVGGLVLGGFRKAGVNAEGAIVRLMGRWNRRRRAEHGEIARPNFRRRCAQKESGGCRRRKGGYMAQVTKGSIPLEDYGLLLSPNICRMLIQLEKNTPDTYRLFSIALFSWVANGCPKPYAPHIPQELELMSQSLLERLFSEHLGRYKTYKSHRR